MTPPPMLGDGGLFPSGWDTTRDLFVVLGRGAVEPVDQWLRRGQRRIFAYLPEETGDAGLPAGVRVTHRVIDLFDGILELRRPLPKRVHIQRQGDPWASDEVHSEVARAVEEALRSRRLLTESFDRLGPGWILQGAELLPRIGSHPSVAALQGAFRKRPCFLVSPGPSLDENAAGLRAVQGRAVILSVVQALGPLRAAGVRPDVVLAVDPGEEHLRHYDRETEPEALCIGVSAHPGHWDRPAKQHFSLAAAGGLDDWIFDAYGEDARLRSGGSASGAALALALRMGCDPIVFLGQDLAFPDHRCYAAAHPDGGLRIEPSDDGHAFRVVDPAGERADDGRLLGPSRQLVKVSASRGGLIYTSETFEAYLAWFDTAARSLEGRTGLFNCTGGGANLRGMQQRPLEDVIAAYLHGSVPLGEILADRAATVDLGQRRRRTRTHAEAILASLRPALDLAARCRDLAAEATSDAGRLAELQSAAAELTAALGRARILSRFAPAEILAAQERAQEARTLADNLGASAELFTVVERVARELQGPLERAVTALEDRGG